MKKIYLIPFLAILLVGIGSAVFVIPGGYQLTKDEMSEVSDGDIANYMNNNFQIENYKLMENKIIVYYNITYVEPTKNGTETQYKVFTQPKPFIIPKSLWNECINLTTAAVCVDVLVNNEEPLNVSVGLNDNNEKEYRVIYSTYYQAMKEQIAQYKRAKEIRDNSISNELDYLFGEI